MVLRESVEILIPGQAKFRMRIFSANLVGATTIVGKKVDLILGADLFKGLGFSISPSSTSFALGPSGVASPPAPFKRIALEDQGALLKVVVGAEVLKLTVDLGFDGGLAVKPQIWDRLQRSGPRTKKHIMDVHGNLSSVDFDIVPLLQIGSMAFNDVPVCNCPVRDGAADGLIGMAVLRDASFVLDQGASALWIAPASKRARK